MKIWKRHFFGFLFGNDWLTYGEGATYEYVEYVIGGLMAATWSAWTVLAGACGAGA